MKKRNIPFGYQWENGVITAHPTESKIVIGIFTAYITGQSLLQIAEALNKNGVEYLPGVVKWNKARLKRMIEDARYLGTESFPAIVEQTAFDKAQAIKFDRNTQKDIDRTAEIRTLPVPVCCATCGVPMRRLHDSRTSHQEKWVCQSCSTAIKITDTDLLRAITDRLNDLLADPEQVHYTPATHESPVELLRLKNEIGRMLDGTMIDKDLLKNLREKDRDSDAGLNPKLEKVVTIGGIIVAVVIGCVFLALLANAFGILNFGRKSAKTKKTQTQTESVVKKETEDSTEAQTEAATKAAQQVTVPQITGLSEADAQRMLESFGLKGVSSGTTSSTQYSAGQVCSQNPAQGELVSKGDTVTYQIVQEDEGIVLDDLKNYEKSMAQAFLLTKGLQCSLDESQYSDTIDAGHVISTSPEAGTTLKPGDTVTLYISQGAEPSQDPADYVTLWSVVGYTEEQATKALKMLDLEPDYQYEYSDTVAQGMVISQSVGSDEQVPRGTTVTLVISNGPAPSDTQDDTISVTNGSDGVWKCDASLETPQGYNGQQVRITLVQDGVGEATIFEGTTTFPYHLQVQGASGISTGTAYVYLLDDNGNVTNQIEYAGIKFSQAR